MASTYWMAEGELRGEQEHIADFATEAEAVRAAKAWLDGLSELERATASAWASEWEGDADEKRNTGHVVDVA